MVERQQQKPQQEPTMALRSGVMSKSDPVSINQKTTPNIPLSLPLPLSLSVSGVEQKILKKKKRLTIEIVLTFHRSAHVLVALQESLQS